MENSIGNIIPQLQKQWGKKPGEKKFHGPQWARFRMFVQYDKGNAKYPSWDYLYTFSNGIKARSKSERIGLEKLILEQHRQLKQGKKYRYINIFCNLSNNLDVVTGNFDYHICTINNGVVTWKNPLYWREDNAEMLDIKRMLEYRKSTLN